ncbi:hypothetical protein ACOMHN_030527 [Nucella lapillus]
MSRSSPLSKGPLWMAVTGSWRSTRSHKAQWIVCIHYVLTQIEEPGVILSEVQKKQRKEKEFLQGGVTLDIRHTDMESLFSPMASNVEDSFFIPPWVNKVKMKKTNEQDHLTFLSPKAGEADMPLELPSELPSQLFQDSQMGLFRPGDRAGDMKHAAPLPVAGGAEAGARPDPHLLSHAGGALLRQPLPRLLRLSQLLLPQDG